MARVWPFGRAALGAGTAPAAAPQSGTAALPSPASAAWGGVAAATASSLRAALLAELHADPDVQTINTR
jgi:hypothetical protein